jgi:hypothetical protein
MDFGGYRCFYMQEGRLEHAIHGGGPSRVQTAYQTVAAFWPTHGNALQRDYGHCIVKHGFVERIKELHHAIAGGADDALTHPNIRGILAEQRAFMIQFETCLDEFNAYLTALRLMDACIQHGI